MNEQEIAFWGNTPQHTIDYANEVCAENRQRKNIQKYADLSDVELRRKITRVLEPVPAKISSVEYNPWAHQIDVDVDVVGANISTVTKCTKCHKDNVDVYLPCSIPTGANGSWADLADKLLMPLNRGNLCATVREFPYMQEGHVGFLANGLITFMYKSARVRCCILLAVRDLWQ